MEHFIKMEISHLAYIGRKVLFLYLSLFFSCIASSAISYEYDSLSRLTSITYSDNARITYTYDANGNRLSETITHNVAVPTISQIPDQFIVVNETTGTIAFTVEDSETGAEDLLLSGTSTNTVLVPVENIVFGGTGTNRTVVVTPAINQTGTTTITLTLSDGISSVSSSFLVIVSAPSTGSIFVTSYGSGNIVGFTTEGTSLGNFGSTEIQPGNTNLAVDRDGNVYVTINANWTVRKFSESGSSLGTLLTASNGIRAPWYITCGPDGDLYVVNSGAGTVSRYSPSGETLGAVISGLTNPSAMAISSSGEFYVSFGNEGTVRRFSSTGSDLGVVISDLNMPRAIAFDPEGRMFIAENATDGNVHMYDSSGTFLDTVVSPHINLPVDIVFDDDGRLYVANGLDGKIVRFSSDYSTNEVFADSGLNSHSGIAFRADSSQAPIISNISNQTISANGNTGTIAFSVGDALINADDLIITKTSSNTALIPIENIVLGGDGTNRTVIATPVAGLTGQSTIIIVVNNGTLSVSDTFTITVEKLPQTISLASLTDKTYGDGPFVLNATASSSLAVSYSVVSGPATIMGNTVSLGGAGTVTIQASQAGSHLYSPAPNVLRTFTIAKALLNARADDKGKFEGWPNMGLTITITGFVHGETATVINTLPVINTPATVDSPAGTYPITLTGGNDNNYVFFLVDGTLTIIENPDLWQDATELQNGWRRLDWFGSFAVREAWIYHEDLGWLSAAGAGIEGFIYYDAGTETWNWSFEEIFPWIYDFNEARWIDLGR